MPKTFKGKWYFCEKDYHPFGGTKLDEGRCYFCDKDNTIIKKEKRDNWDLTFDWDVKRVELSPNSPLHEWKFEDIICGMPIVYENGDYKVIGIVKSVYDNDIRLHCYVDAEGYHGEEKVIEIEDARRHVRPATPEEHEEVNGGMNQALDEYEVDEAISDEIVEKLAKHKSGQINEETGWYVCLDDADEFKKDEVYMLSEDKATLVDIDENTHPVNEEMLNEKFRKWTVRDVKHGDFLSASSEERKVGDKKTSPFVMVVDMFDELPWSYKLLSICYVKEKTGMFVDKGKCHDIKTVRPSTNKEKDYLLRMMKVNKFNLSEKLAE